MEPEAPQVPLAGGVAAKLAASMSFRLEGGNLKMLVWTPITLGRNGRNVPWVVKILTPGLIARCEMWFNLDPVSILGKNYKTWLYQVTFPPLGRKKTSKLGP